MKILIDASVFLKLLLDEPGADQAQELLEAVENGNVIGYVTPIILEEVAFKLVFARVSEILDTKNIWRIREALKFDERTRRACIEPVKVFHEYVEYMSTKGLRIEYVTSEDWRKSIEIMERYGLLPADALHVATALRIGVEAVATFDEDFRRVEEVKTVP